MTRGSRRRGATPLFGLPLIVLVTFVPTSAFGLTEAGAAATRARGGPEPSVRIVDQTTFVPADGIFDLLLDVTRPSPDPDDAAVDGGDHPSLSITFHERLETESGVEQPPGQPLHRLDPIALDRAPRDEVGRVRLTIPIRSSAAFDDQERVLLPEPGVYPITIELRDGDGPLAAARTELVRQPIETDDSPTEIPVEVAVVLNVTSAEGLSVGDAIDLLVAHPAVPLTVVLDQGVVTQLQGAPESAQALAGALAERPVLAVPTLDLDPSAMAEIGQEDLYLAAARSDRQAIIDLGLQPATGIALLDSPLTEDGIGVLAQLGVRSVLDVSDRLVGSGVIDSGLADPSRPVQVIRTDSDLNQVLRGGTGISTEPGPHRAIRALARLTLRRQIDDSPVVIGGPALGVDPKPVLDAFLRSLSRAGAPQPVGLVDVAGGPSLRVAERPRQDLAPVAVLVDEIRLTVAAYESSHVSGGTLPDDYRQRLAGALTLQRNPEDRLRALTLIANQLAGELGAIQIHQPQPVTLAARSAPIPLVIENTSPGLRRVVLRFRGDRVTTDADGQQLVVQPGTSSFDIEIEARSLGASPLEVSAWSGDESVLLAETRFEIRSTAVPGLGLLISLSALALLGLWWIVDHRRRHPDDREAPLDLTPGQDHPVDRPGRPGGETTELTPTSV